MRVLVFATQHLKTGGIESHLQQFCEHMKSQGIVTDLVVLNSKMLSETEDFFKERCNKVFLGSYGRSIKRIFWMIRTALRLKKIKYNAIYTNGQGSSIRMFVKLAKVKGTWVHHHHTSGDAQDQETWTLAYRKVLEHADTVIACSNTNAADIEVAVNRSVNSIPCFSRRITVEKTCFKRLDKVRLGYFGRLIPEKGIDIINALSEELDQEEIEFHIWGEGSAYPPSYFTDKKVKYHGAFNGVAGLTEAVKTLDGFLLLSTHAEGLPISLLEIMSAGMPWLATNRGGIADIAVDTTSTRLVTAGLGYDQYKVEVKSFAKDIFEGNISRDLILELYNQKFSSTALIAQWIKVLNLN